MKKSGVKGKPDHGGKERKFSIFNTTYCERFFVESKPFFVSNESKRHASQKKE